MLLSSRTPADGLTVFVKKECPTCRLIQPVIRDLAKRTNSIIVFAQDDVSAVEGLAVIDDTSLEQSFRQDIEAVPTIIRFANGREVDRTFGWNRDEWQRVTGLADLGRGLPHMQPGCGSKSREPGVFEHLVALYGDPGLASRKIEIGEWDDPIEAGFERGWSDGLPLVPPTDERILRMLGGTARKPDEIVGAYRQIWHLVPSKK